MLAATAIAVGIVAMVGAGCPASYETAVAPSATVPEVYPGIISPVDVDPKTAPAAGTDGGELVRLPTEKKVAHLVARYGVEAVVAVRLDGCPPDAGRLIQQKIGAAVFSGASFTQTSGDRTVVYLAPVTDLEGFAGRLDLGETTVDSEKRVVLVKVDPAKLTAKAARPEDQRRIWLDNTGQYEIEATLVGLKDGQVTLKKPDGTTVTLPLERLSENDQKFVKSATDKRRGP